MVLNNRQETLLAAIIKEYIDSAQPVSSKLIEKSGFFGLGSATIRNEMNELEESGYLSQPYTSGGRMPTDKAYRYFVDNLLELRKAEPSASQKSKIRAAIRETGNDPRRINKTVGQLLSNLSENLVITNIYQDSDFHKFGLSGLFEMPEFRKFDRIFKLTSFFDEFESLFSREVGELIGADEDFKIFIGRENPIQGIKDETVIFSKYNLPHKYTGSLTLIGPTRMNYQRNIGLVKYTMEELNKTAEND